MKERLSSQALFFFSNLFRQPRWPSIPRHSHHCRAQPDGKDSQNHIAAHIPQGEPHPPESISLSVSYPNHASPTSPKTIFVKSRGSKPDGATRSHNRYKSHSVTSWGACTQPGQIIEVLREQNHRRNDSIFSLRAHRRRPGVAAPRRSQCRVPALP